MATNYVPLDILAARVFTTVTPPELLQDNGTNFPVMSYAFDAGGTEAIFWEIPIKNYGSGNLTLEIDWYATATSGNVVWTASIAAVTPGDAQSMLTDAFATANTVTTAASGTASGPTRSTITISNLDSLATGDTITLKLTRDGGNGSDTMSGDAKCFNCTLSYSDT